MKKSKEKSKKLKKTEKILRKEIKTNNQRPEVRSYRQNQQKRTYRLDERAEGARENISDGQKKPENLTCVRLSGFLNTLDWIPVGYVQDEQKGTKKGVTTKKGTDLFTTIQPRPPLPSALNTNACNPLKFFNETSSSGKLPPLQRLTNNSRLITRNGLLHKYLIIFAALQRCISQYGKTSINIKPVTIRHQPCAGTVT